MLIYNIKNDMASFIFVSKFKIQKLNNGDSI